MGAAEHDWNVPPQFNFTRDVVERLAEDPNRRALTFVDREGIIARQTFGQVALDATRWAHLLRGRGTEPGDRVVVATGKVADWLAITLGAIKAGLVTVPCSDVLGARELAFRVRHSGAALLVADRALQGEVDALRGLLDAPVDLLYLDDARLLLPHQPATAPTEETFADDYALILYTSGTSGEPRGVTHTHAFTFANRVQAEHWLGARPGDLVWCTAGTGWAKSIWNVLLGPWSRGAEVMLHEGPFDPEQRLDLIDRLGVTILCQSPTEYQLLASLDELARYPLSRLRHAVSAGEPLAPETIESFRDAHGLTIHDGYGQTETSVLIANTRSAEVRPGSMGLPLVGHDVRLVGDDGLPVAPGVEGDIALGGRPPTLFTRYWQDRDATAAAFRGDWYLTGDRAVRDEDGYFWFAGRADDVITSSGYRVGPYEVESALLSHQAVEEVAAVGKPDPDRGEIVKAYVVLAPGTEPSDELAATLRRHAEALTAAHKVPSEVEFVAALPKTRSGKIRRVELRALQGGGGRAATEDERRRAAAREDAERRAAAEREAAEREAAEAAEREAAEAAEREAAEREAAEAAEREAVEAAEREAAEREAAEAAQREAAEREAAEREAAEAAQREAAEADAAARDAAEREAAEAAEADARRTQKEDRKRRKDEAAASRKREKDDAEAERRRRKEAEAEDRRRAAEEEQARAQAEEDERARVEQQRREAERHAEAERRAAAKERADAEERARAERKAAKRAEPSWRDRRAHAKEERRRRDEEQRRERAEKAAAERRARDEAAAAERAAEEARARAEAEREAREQAEREAREQAERDAREQAERDAAAARAADEDRRRQERAQAASRRRGGRGREPEPAEDEDTPEDPNPALVARLRAYRIAQGREEAADAAAGEADPTGAPEAPETAEDDTPG